MRMVLSLISSAVILTGCADNRGMPPEILLTCPDEPVPGDIQTQSDFLNWVEDLRVAGGECRANLRAVAGMLDSD